MQKTCISAKIEAIKHLHAGFLLTVEQRRLPIGLYRAMFILTPLTSRDLILFLERNHHYVPMIYYRAFQ